MRKHVVQEARMKGAKIGQTPLFFLNQDIDFTMQTLLKLKSSGRNLAKENTSLNALKENAIAQFDMFPSSSEEDESCLQMEE